MITTTTTVTIPFRYISHQQNDVYNLSITIIGKDFIEGPALKKEIMDEIKKSTKSIPSDIRLFSGNTERPTLDIMMYLPSEIRDCEYELIVLESEIETAKRIKKSSIAIGKEALNYLSFIINSNK